MKKGLLLLPAVILLSFFACQKSDVPSTVSRIKPAAQDPRELNQFIQNKVLDKGEFLWEWASDEQVWTALSNSDFVLSVGYRPAAMQNVEAVLHTIDLSDDTWTAAREKVIAMILEEERKMTPGLTEADITAYTMNDLPVLDVWITNPATISKLRLTCVRINGCILSAGHYVLAHWLLKRAGVSACADTGLGVTCAGPDSVGV